MSFALFSFFALVLAVILGTVTTSWTAVAQEFSIGFSVFLAFYLFEALVAYTMKRERSSSASEKDLHRFTSLRRVSPLSPPDNLAPVTERSEAEIRLAEVREHCRSLTLADLIAEIERRCEEGNAPAETPAAPREAVRGRGGAVRYGRGGGRRERREGRLSLRGGQGGESSRQGTRSPLPPRPPEPEPEEPSSPQVRAAPPPRTHARRPPGPRFIAAGELGELRLPHRFLVDPKLAGHVIGRATAELLGLRIRPIRAVPPPGFESYAIRSEGGTSEIIGSTTARVKLGGDMDILDFTVVRDKVETRLGEEIMESPTFRLTWDRVNGTLYQSGTTRIGVWDHRVGEPRAAH